MPLQVRAAAHTLDLARTPDGALTRDGHPADARLTRLDAHSYLLADGPRRRVVTVEPLGPGRARVTVDGRRVDVEVKSETALLLERLGMADAAAGAADREVRAPMPGLVRAVLVAEGQTVAEGDGLVVLEAMKMENELRAPTAGTVTRVLVGPGAAVGKNDLLVEIDA